MEEKSRDQLLEEFSDLLMDLGREVEARLADKEKLEAELREKEAVIMKVQKEVFSIRTRLAKLSTELTRLEGRRREFEEKKFLLEKQNDGK
jgi:chromosome segregation ATPase